jgi:hypothetical protein
MSASSYDVTVNVQNGVQAITVNYSNSPDIITIGEVSRQIELVQLDTSFNNVYSVNDLLGAVNITYSASLGVVNPASAVYTYTASHNLGYSYPMVMVYNTSNELVLAQIDVVNSNVVRIESLVDLNSYRVVVQR